MNYLWEVAIKAKQQNIDTDEIFYKYGQPFSGYMELSFEDINETKVLSEVEINPFYRFYRIFKYLFDPDTIEDEQVIEVIHDLIIHHLIDVDVYMGMNKREYHIKFTIEDMKKGYFGEFVKERISLFTMSEQKILANNVLNLYKAGESIYLLKDTVKKIFVNSYIFSNAEEKDEIFFYLRTNETKKKEEKLNVIKYLFLPFKCTVDVYWEFFIGIIDVEELMLIDEIVIY
jgi:hypothetical protein